jgi:hypothetical protein
MASRKEAKCADGFYPEVIAVFLIIANWQKQQQKRLQNELQGAIPL